MTKADFLLKNDIKKILREGIKDENPRPKYEDGTPAHTYFVNHVVRQYNIAKGEFPICTLRPQAWKTAIREILAIYQNQSNKISEFERYGCGWWKDWSLEDGTIGRSYPYNLESHRPNEMKKTVVSIPVRMVDKKFSEIKNVPMFEALPTTNDKIYLNRYKIIGINEDLTDKKHKYYNIQFISNNYKSFMRSDLIGKSNGVNPYDRTIFGIGYLDEYKDVPNFTELEISVLKDKWENMFRRCYSEKYQKDIYHESYKDIFVHQDWHSFKKFLEDIRYLPQYFLAKEQNFKGWDLDKDYYGSNAYSKDTCVFLKHNENSLYSQVNGCYEITNNEDNSKYYEINITEFAQKINVLQSTLCKSVNNKCKYKNYNFNFLENTNEYVYRYELSRNQINSLINDIKDNPYGRRHIISFWNWSNIDKKSLVECCYETIWNVRGEYLDMLLVQRSGDMLTASGAGGVNEIQYGALLLMVAKATGYKAGKFTHMVANEHIYDRHVEAANELLNRCEDLKIKFDENHHYDYEFDNNVQLEFNPKSDNFYDFTIDDFNMVNYNPIKPQLKLELGI